MIKLLIFDFDGVLRLWNDALITEREKELGLPEGSVFSAAFRHEDYLQAITGEIEDPRWREKTLARLEAEHGPASRDLMDTWNKLEGDLDHEMLALVRSLRRQARVVLLSNNTSRLEEDMARMGLLEELDQIYNTSRVGIAKPDTRVYEHILQAEGMRPEETVFIDDLRSNIEAAAAIGIHAHHYEGIEDLKQFLISLGLQA